MNQQYEMAAMEKIEFSGASDDLLEARATAGVVMGAGADEIDVTGPMAGRWTVTEPGMPSFDVVARFEPDGTWSVGVAFTADDEGGPETGLYPILQGGRVVGGQMGHPPGVECDPTLATCSCGRLQLGLRRADDEGEGYDLPLIRAEFVRSVSAPYSIAMIVSVPTGTTVTAVGR